jgi:hypothetical protein
MPAVVSRLDMISSDPLPISTQGSQIATLAGCERHAKMIEFSGVEMPIRLGDGWCVMQCLMPLAEKTTLMRKSNESDVEGLRPDICTTVTVTDRNRFAGHVRRIGARRASDRCYPTSFSRASTSPSHHRPPASDASNASWLGTSPVPKYTRRITLSKIP